MGYIAEWEKMIDTLFQDMYFFVNWSFLPHEEYEYTSEEVTAGGLKEHGTKVQKRAKESLEKESPLKKSSLQIRQSNGINAMALKEKLSAKESFEAFENMVISDFIRADKNDFLKANGADAYESADESFNAKRELFDVDFYDGFLSEDAYEVLSSAEKGNALYEEIEKMLYRREDDFFYNAPNEEEYMKRDTISIRGDKAGQIIAGATRDDTKTLKREIIIEPVRSVEKYSAPDMDATLDMLTERLCEMMSKGADGFYL